MPRTGYATVDDTTFTDRAVLVCAKISECTDLLAVAKDGDALAVRRRNDPRGFVGDGLRRSHDEPAVATRGTAAVAGPLAPPGEQLEDRHASERAAEHDRDDRMTVGLHDGEGDMQHHQPIGDVDRHVQ